MSHQVASRRGRARPAATLTAGRPTPEPMVATGGYVCDMATPVSLPELTPGTRVQDPLLVLDVETRGTGDTAHIILTFGNASGRIASAPFWPSEQHLVAGVRKGQVAQVIGEVQLYRERRQLKVTSLRILPKGMVDTRELLPSISDPDPYWEVLDRWRSEIRGPRLRAVLDLFYTDPEFREQYELCPASLAGHHGLLGGLLKHTAEVATIARATSRVAGADGDLVMAGVLLHDIGKLEAYRYDTHFEMTEAGALIGHIVLGSLMLDRAVRGAASMPCTDAELQILQHLVLSHHGRHEYGAPVLPMTVEAEVLHFADSASARTASMADAINDPENFADDHQVSVRRIWSLENRRVFRGTSDWGRGTGGE
jgi:3'-5' exoribonuclease